MTATPETTETAPPGGRTRRGMTVMIGVLLVAAFVMVLNETVMSIALPHVMADFSVPASTAQWLTTVFMLTMAVVIPLTGFVLQRFASRAVFAGALLLFTAGTLLAALAPAFGVLVAARALQAAGTAVVLPLLTTTILTFVPVQRRGTVFGLVSVVISVAPAVGPTLSGVILSAFGWRAVFVAVLPVAVLALGLGLVLVRDIGTPRPLPLDLPSVLLSATAFGALIFGLSSIGESTEGHALLPPALPVAVGATALALFVRRQLRLQREDRALLDLRPFALRPFSIGVVVLLIAMASLFGALILLPLYLQNVRGLSALETGLAVLPGGVLMGVVAPFIGRLYDRVGPRPLAIPGAVVLAAALFLMAFLFDERTGALTVTLLHMLLTLGLGFLMTPLMTSALGSLPQHLYSHGSAIMNTLQQLAGAVGTALFVTLMALGTAGAAAGGAPATAAQAAGIQQAFLVGACVAVVAVVAACFVRGPETRAAQAVSGGDAS
ncbi:DHA2 family efflux MFS transporter permease subunit [Kocuria flava]|uniref:DHA2 family efflux MFS transporter permease subunit n=1 Tax=Kocuria flava TaxID=446860 RepID=UPI002F91C340